MYESGIESGTSEEAADALRYHVLANRGTSILRLPANPIYDIQYIPLYSIYSTSFVLLLYSTDYLSTPFTLPHDPYNFFPSLSPTAPCLPSSDTPPAPSPGTSTPPDHSPTSREPCQALQRGNQSGSWSSLTTRAYSRNAWKSDRMSQFPVLCLPSPSSRTPLLCPWWWYSTSFAQYYSTTTTTVPGLAARLTPT